MAPDLTFELFQLHKLTKLVWIITLINWSMFGYLNIASSCLYLAISYRSALRIIFQRERTMRNLLSDVHISGVRQYRLDTTICVV